MKKDEIDFSYIDADNRRSNVLLHNDNGLLVDNLGNNYTQSYLEEGNVPVILGKMPRNTSPYFDPFGALTFVNAAAAPITSLSPSNVVGSIRKAHDYSSFMNSFTNQDNSGFFTDAYAQEHPYISTLGNLAGDIAIGSIGDKAIDAVRNLPNVSAYRKLGYKANKLQKRLGLIDRHPEGGFIRWYSPFRYDHYGPDYLNNVFQNEIDKNPSKYLEYRYVYPDIDIKQLHNAFKREGFKNPAWFTVKDNNGVDKFVPMNKREYSLFSDNPEYFQFIQETHLPPLEQSTVDKFIDRQRTSLRGVTASNEEEARRFLTETNIHRDAKGGDRLGTKGGLYTSNSTGIADRFKNPVGSGTKDGYVAKLQMNFKPDSSLSIEEQLKQMRDKVYMAANNELSSNYRFNDIMRNKAIRDGATMFEANYGRSNGDILNVTERAYLPNMANDGINTPVSIKELNYYPNQVDKRGRWGTTQNVDYVPQDNEYFIPKQYNSTTDYIKYMKEILRKKMVPSEEKKADFMREVVNRMDDRIIHGNNIAKQAKNAYLRNKEILNGVKKAGVGVGLAAPLAGATYGLYESDKKESSINHSFDVVSDYYFNGNKDRYSEDRVKNNLNYLKNNAPEEYEFLTQKIKGNNSHSDGGYLNNDWNSLSYKDKAEMMRAAVANGITTLPEIREAYNKFAKGGKMNNWTMQDEAGYRYWRSKLPRNLRETNDDDYDMRAAYKAGMQPEWNDADKSYHLGSRDSQSGKILKAPHHPTYLKALMEDARLGYYPTMDANGNTYTETWKGNRVYAKGGYMPSAKIRKDIATWEGSSMKTNRSFEAEARDFNSAIPSSVRDKLSSSQLDALFSYGYNVGMGKLKERVLPVLTAYAQGKATREDVQKSMWATKDSQLRGLNNRRNWERSLFGGNYKTSFGDDSVGSHIDPTRFQIDDNFFNDISSQINSIELPQVQLPESMDIDPSTLYKAPIIDDTLLTMPKLTNKENPYNPRQKALERMQGINNLMGMMGMDSPFKGLPGVDTSSPGLMSYVNAIYS